MDDSANLTYQFADAQGSVFELANASGQVTEKYACDAYGRAVVTGAGAAAYRYTGRLWDAETGQKSGRASRQRLSGRRPAAPPRASALKPAEFEVT